MKMWKHCKCQKDEDAKKLHQTFEPTLCKKQNTKTEVKHNKNEETGVYNPLDILKLVAGDGTVGFLKHIIDGGTEKLLLHSTLGDLVLKCKGLS